VKGEKRIDARKKPKMIATETTEDMEGKYSVLSVYSGGQKVIHYIL